MHGYSPPIIAVRVRLLGMSPGVEVRGDGHKRRGFHDDILPVEDPLATKLVNDPVLLNIHGELAAADQGVGGKENEEWV